MEGLLFLPFCIMDDELLVYANLLLIYSTPLT